MRFGRTALCALAIATLLAGCVQREPQLGGELMKVIAKFEGGKTIEKMYTCDGANISPELNLVDIPPQAASIAIIADDPDAPAGTFVHWVAWNIPPTAKISEGIDVKAAGGSEGRNDFGTAGYRGPCPPPGKPHRYFFRVYALDANLSLSEGATKEQLLSAMEGHVIGKGEVMGIYGR